MQWIFVVVFLNSFLSFSQCDTLAVKQLLSKSKLLYAKTLSYKVYTGYEYYENSMDPTGKLTGIMIKKDDYVYNKMDATELIQYKGKALTISHSEQMASYKENAPLQIKTSVDIEVLLPYMDSLSLIHI